MVPTGFAEEVSTRSVGLRWQLCRPSDPAAQGTTEMLRELHWLHPRTWHISTEQHHGAETSCQRGGYREEYSKWHQKTNKKSGEIQT